ncbi:50S ribosomal protein L1 [Candidatus Pantoea edessiphila]|uniref:Large ribosomal subunit protein uL1 n=1 Tax=Candidatus Pantoea edessiphila TaxID=2044610 RepID=A0A2P5T123_9GAMM|nr:50S ribosomal protein L1 [Candidatus Pantoea edessiphila]PPI88294.1 50S ribosomal protein L1 [Candidatus Pantoea edessiphila]
MIKVNKRMNKIINEVDLAKKYSCLDSISMLKKLATAKFTESIDVAINLSIDPKKSNQNVRGATILPHGTGRLLRIAVFAQGIQADEAKKEGATLVGMEDLVEHIKKGNINFDVVIASTDAMNIVGQLGQILGTRGLMPNPKMGTVTSNVAKTVKDIKSGQIRYKNDKNGIIHTTIGKINFEDNKLKENLEYLIADLKKAKPIQSKGNYIKKISISSTMGVGIQIDLASLNI